MKITGESLMKRFLDTIVAEDKRHKDNYRPDWLRNPVTGKCMEIDRFDPDDDAGFEFQGMQHYLYTEGLDKAGRLLKRDKAKKTICELEGVRLFFVTARDLTWGKMRELIQEAFGKRVRLCSGVLSRGPLNGEANRYRSHLRLAYPDEVTHFLPANHHRHAENLKQRRRENGKRVTRRRKKWLRHQLWGPPVKREERDKLRWAKIGKRFREQVRDDKASSADSKINEETSPHPGKASLAGFERALCRRGGCERHAAEGNGS